jgi:hypothetical protein
MGMQIVRQIARASSATLQGLACNSSTPNSPATAARSALCPQHFDGKSGWGLTEK